VAAYVQITKNFFSSVLLLKQKLKRMIGKIALPTLLLIISMVISSCGGSNDSKTVTVKKQFDIGIDTSTLTTKEAVLAAAKKLMAAKAANEAVKDSDPDYKSHYYSILKMKGIIRKKGAAVTAALPGNDRPAFVDSINAIME
jgi:hypothetical protein